MTRRLVAVLVALLCAVVAVPAQAAPGPRERVVVTLRDGTGPVPAVAARLARAHGGRVGHVYDTALRGFALDLPAARVAALSRDPAVAVAHVDEAVFRASQSREVPVGIVRVRATENATAAIDGIDSRVDADIAILDSGIDGRHPDLHVAGGTDCSSGTSCIDTPLPVDLNGHGTHVAGTAAALDNGGGVVGVAPGARLWSVRVLDENGEGGLDAVLAGFEWAADHADTLEVVNASFGCECPSTYDAIIAGAVDAMVDRGLVVVVAAGNEGQDASGISPANDPDVLAVGAYADFDGQPGGASAVPDVCLAEQLPDRDDEFASFSNHGGVVDIAAPGVCVVSTIPTSFNPPYGISSGTSMAAPHVAGAAALFIAERDIPVSDRRAADVRAGLLDEWSASSTGACGIRGGSPGLRVLDLTSCGEFTAASDPKVHACPPDRVPPAGFDDVAATNAHADAIDCVVWWEIARGTTPTTYAPGTEVSRAQMATFIAAVVDRSLGRPLPDTAPDAFPDDEGSPHERNIDRLAAAGIIGGRPDGTFAPSARVQRDQMATFLVNAYEYLTETALPPGGDRFHDDDGSAHEGNIDKAAAAGFTGGKAPGVYDPSARVRRDQMATFIARTLGVLVDGGYAALPA